MMAPWHQEGVYGTVVAAVLEKVLTPGASLSEVEAAMEKANRAGALAVEGFGRAMDQAAEAYRKRRKEEEAAEQARQDAARAERLAKEEALEKSLRARFGPTVREVLPEFDRYHGRTVYAAVSVQAAADQDVAKHGRPGAPHRGGEALRLCDVQRFMGAETFKSTKQDKHKILEALSYHGWGLADPEAPHPEVNLAEVCRTCGDIRSLHVEGGPVLCQAQGCTCPRFKGQSEREDWPGGPAEGRR